MPALFCSRNKPRMVDGRIFTRYSRIEGRGSSCGPRQNPRLSLIRTPVSTRTPPQLAYPSTSKQEYLQWRKALRKGPPGPSPCAGGKEHRGKEALAGARVHRNAAHRYVAHIALVSLPSCRRRLPSMPGGRLRLPRARDPRILRVVRGD